jgi:hypothetical protein
MAAHRLPLACLKKCGQAAPDNAISPDLRSMAWSRSRFFFRFFVAVLFVAVLYVAVTLLCGAPWEVPAAAQTQSIPTVVAPPQQMTPYSVTAAPATYPSTDPSPFPAAYPSTMAPAFSPVIPSFDRPPSPLVASAAGGIGGSAGPALTAAPGAIGAPGAPANSGPLYTPYGSPDAMAAARSAGAPDPNSSVDLNGNEPWSWQVVPTGLMYKSYLADIQASRLGSQLVYVRGQGAVLDSTIGTRVGFIRYGTDSEVWPQGWQLDVEGAAFPRLDANRTLVECDYQFGVPLTVREGPWEMKLGYLHYCAHIGDYYLLTHPDFDRLNFLRDSIVWGLAVYLTPELRLYSEVNWAFHVDGGAQPWRFQFGADFSSVEPTGPLGAPFLAINGLVRQENDYSGNVTVRAGWQWRSQSGHLFRFGLQYFNGMSDEMQFFNRFEQQIGGGIWYDF